MPSSQRPPGTHLWLNKLDFCLPAVREEEHSRTRLWLGDVGRDQGSGDLLQTQSSPEVGAIL